MSSSSDIYLKTINNPDYTSIAPDRDFSRGHDEYIQPPEILFGDQRKQIECTIKPFDENEHKSNLKEHEETERADASYVTIDENPVDERRTKTIELNDPSGISPTESKNQNSQNRRKQRLKPDRTKTQDRKFPGELKKEKSLRRYTKTHEEELPPPPATTPTMSQEPKQVAPPLATAGARILKSPLEENESAMKRQAATGRPPSLTPPPPGPSQYQLEREKQLKAEQNLAHQIRLNSANMEVENHAQRKQLKTTIIQALTGAFSYSEKDSQLLKDHKKLLRESLLSPQGTSLITKLFLPFEAGSNQSSRQGNQDMFGTVIQH